MDFESAVLYYLAHEGLFVSPQFSILSPDGQEWSCPDFVGLDIPKRQVVVAEVTKASNIRNLAEKVQKREDQWFGLLRELLEKKGIITHDWSFMVWVFVRKDSVKTIKQIVGESTEIKITALEEIAFDWEWNWPQALRR